jgi:hypothetical protein
MLRQLLEWWLRCDNTCVVIRFHGLAPVPPPTWLLPLLSFLPRIG